MEGAVYLEFIRFFMMMCIRQGILYFTFKQRTEEVKKTVTRTLCKRSRMKVFSSDTLE